MSPPWKSPIPRSVPELFPHPHAGIHSSIPDHTLLLTCRKAAIGRYRPTEHPIDADELVSKYTRQEQTDRDLTVKYRQQLTNGNPVALIISRCIEDLNGRPVTASSSIQNLSLLTNRSSLCLSMRFAIDYACPDDILHYTLSLRSLLSLHDIIFP